VKLATFSADHEPEIGVITDDDRLISISRAIPDLAYDLKSLIADWEKNQPIVEAIVQNARHSFTLDDVDLRAPISNPGKMLIFGFIRPELFADTGMPKLPYPPIIQKFNSAISDPGGEVQLPAKDAAVDCGVYINVIIGKSGKCIPPNAVDDHIFGYSIALALGERKRQYEGLQWAAGGSLDGFAPLGPWIVTKDAIPEPEKCKIKGYLNGTLVQDCDLAPLLFDIREQVSYLTQAMTIHPGDMFFDGSPLGFRQENRAGRHLQDGDVIRSEISQIGCFENVCRKSVGVDA
jgi:2-keto-4-pentenoate hydratase/2-oxohepta-3-ene-1,7-dioic acid hydratase in catechol pathway